MGFRYSNLSFFRRNFDQKPQKVCYKVLLSKNFQQQSCSVINYLWNGINILVGDDLVPLKFGPKGADTQSEECAFHVSHAARCAVSDSRPSCFEMSCLQNLITHIIYQSAIFLAHYIVSYAARHCTM